MKRLVISSIIDKIELPTPTDTGTLYAPTFVRYKGVEYLAGIGGDTANDPGFKFPVGHPQRHADSVYVCARFASGSWNEPYSMISVGSFPWLSQPNLNELDHIGGLGGGQFVQIGERLMFLGVASVNDPNCAVGEHTPEMNPYGSQLVPFSHFYGFDFELKPSGLSSSAFEPVQSLHEARPVPDTNATQFASVRPPAGAGLSGGFKGLTGCRSAILDPITGSITQWLEYWGTDIQPRQIVVRTFAGLRRSVVWSGGPSWEASWEEFRLVLPEWVNGPDPWKGNSFPHLASHVAMTRLFDGPQFLLVANPTETSAEYSVSGLITSWPNGIVDIESNVPGMGDGSGRFIGCHIGLTSKGPSLFAATKDASSGGSPFEHNYWVELALTMVDTVAVPGPPDPEPAPPPAPTPAPVPTPAPPPVVAGAPYEMPRNDALPIDSELIALGFKTGDHRWASSEGFGVYWTVGRGAVKPAFPPPNSTANNPLTWSDQGAIK